MGDAVSEYPDDPRALRLYAFGEFMHMPFPARAMIMDPVLPVQGLAMVYAPRGLGKTFFALGLAHAVAGGGSFLRWQAPKPRSVLYIDGEMPARVLKERIELVIDSTCYAIGDRDYFNILSCDQQGDVSLDISDPADQALINRYLTNVDLVVLDNLATLHRGGPENEGESWLSTQHWLLQLRRSGRAVLIVHHSGKGGQQRGTSRREDVLDTVIALRRPFDYTADQGARFEVHIEKGRGLYGAGAQPFEAQLVTANGRTAWTIKPLDDVNRAKVIALLREGQSVRDIAEETGLSKSKVGRIRIDAAQAGLLDDAP